MAHISLPQSLPPFPQECEVHPACAADRGAQSSGGLYTTICISKGCKEGQKGTLWGSISLEACIWDSIYQGSCGADDGHRYSAMLILSSSLACQAYCARLSRRLPATPAEAKALPREGATALVCLSLICCTVPVHACPLALLCLSLQQVS